MDSVAIVLAAGKGVRMKSKTPKVLHAAAGRSLIGHVVHHLLKAGVGQINLVVGHEAAAVKKHLQGLGQIKFFEQKNQLGTADAVKSAGIDALTGTVLICNGDHPLITSEDYAATLERFKSLGCDLMVVSSVVKDPKSFGRIVRDGQGQFKKIVEEKDASTSEKKINEVNSGLYVVKADVLKKYLPLIQNNNSKKEFYLTDIVSLALDSGLKVVAEKKQARVCRGVNDQRELAQAAQALYLRKARELMDQGVTILDPHNTYIEDEVKVGAGSTISPGCLIQGKTEIGEDCLVENNCRIQDSVIDQGVEVRWGTLIEKSTVGARALVGPYARVRPESVVGEDCHVGNFVELKKAVLAKGVKANHLTYLGDVEIGEDTNVGCGTITCNYAVDRKKYKTVIGKRVFVGSDCQFVAPVTIGDDAVVGSGSTITKDVPSKALAVARGRQFIKENYQKGK